MREMVLGALEWGGREAVNQPNGLLRRPSAQKARPGAL